MIDLVIGLTLSWVNQVGSPKFESLGTSDSILYSETTTFLRIIGMVCLDTIQN